jgi:hypothetical protein
MGFQIISDGPSRTAGRSRVHKRCGSNAAAGPRTTRRAASTSKSKARHSTPIRRQPPSGRPQRFLGRAQFGKDRPPDRQQRRPGWAVRLNYILNAGIFTVAVSAGSAGVVMDQVQFLAHIRRRVSDHRHRGADRAGLQLRKHDPGDRPRGRADRSDDQLALREPQHFRVTPLQLPDADRCKRRLQQSAGQSQLRRCIATEHGELDGGHELPMKFPPMILVAAVAGLLARSWINSSIMRRAL